MEGGESTILEKKKMDTSHLLKLNPILEKQFGFGLVWFSLFVCCLFEIGSHCVAQVGPELKTLLPQPLSLSTYHVWPPWYIFLSPSLSTHRSLVHPVYTLNLLYVIVTQQ